MAAPISPGEPPAPFARVALWRRIAWPKLWVWTMRILSVAWMAKGLLAWASILGVPVLAGDPFELQPPARQALTIAFAILDLVAAVGLWLTTNWGGVMWIFAVLSAIVATVLSPDAAAGDSLQAGLSGVLILIYLVISWLAAHEPETI